MEGSYKIVHVHKDRIVAGNAIVCPDGKTHNVCQKDIGYSTFMGVSIFGDNYKCGYKLVPKVIYPIYRKGIKLWPVD